LAVVDRGLDCIRRIAGGEREVDAAEEIGHLIPADRCVDRFIYGRSAGILLISHAAAHQPRAQYQST
jgi:hypothetical protein